MKGEAPAYIVIDTHVLISAGLLPNSVSAQALILAFERFVMAQNQATWHELQNKIVRKKFDRYFGATGRLDLLARLAKTLLFLNLWRSLWTAGTRQTTSSLRWRWMPKPPAFCRATRICRCCTPTGKFQFTRQASLSKSWAIRCPNLVDPQSGFGLSCFLSNAM